ncbi:MAG: type II toxin-antitoxin system VapC family toxin [Bacteroidia bacterium]|nr:type II toxin-antitoxin system VapC family toxin [Bacteroidia bacterium]
MITTALDTNVAIDLLNGNVEILLNCEKYTSLYLPVTVCGELLYGAINSNSSKKNLIKYRGFISNCTILNINSAIAEKYASIRKGLKDKGTPIPENDIWIAATCIVYEIPLATSDKHFNNIEGLKLTE